MGKVKLDTLKLKPETLKMIKDSMANCKRQIIWTKKMDDMLAACYGKIPMSHILKVFRVETDYKNMSDAPIRKRVEALGLKDEHT